MLGWELPPHNSGGLGVACYQLCKHLAGQGVDIEFVVPYTADHSDITFMKVQAATPYDVALIQKALGGAYDSRRYEEVVNGSGSDDLPTSLRAQQLRYVAYVRQLIEEGEYDLIHAHDWLTYEAAVLAKNHLDIPLIAHVHATEFDRAGGNHGNPLVHDIEYTGLVMADRIVAVSQATKEILIERYDIPADKIDVVHNSIDPEDFVDSFEPSTYAYISHMKDKGYTIVASVGRLTLQKGLTFLMEAAQKAVYYHPKLLFVIAGSGEQLPELLELSADLGIAENVVFTGFVRGAAWREVFALADQFVMPSISEPFGLVALEAAGFGNAVLISEQSGVKEVMHHMLRFDFWDTDRLASQIVALAESEAMKTELLAGAAQEFRALSWRRVAERCRDIYTQVAPQEVAA